MEKVIVGVTPGGVTDIEFDGHTYDIRITEYSNVGGYAPVLITDKNTGATYFSYGYFELNNHVIITKWKYKYDYNRDNWICGDDLIISVT